MTSGKDKLNQTTSRKTAATTAKKPSSSRARKNKTSSLEKAASAVFSPIKWYTDTVVSGLSDVARMSSSLPLMAGEKLFKDFYGKAIGPERLNALAEAGHFLRDAREVAGLNMQDLATALNLSDTSLLEEVEKGHAALPFDMILRVASLIARHDPVPFILNFLRTYHLPLEKRLDNWGISALPKQYERERRFVNLIRQHDVIRDLSDAEFERFIHYQSSAIQLTLEVMTSEKKAHQSSAAKRKKS